MTKQTTFLNVETPAMTVEVIKTYDRIYAHQCFDQMTDQAVAFLRKSLELDSRYELPTQNGSVDPVALNWEDVEEDAREDWNLFSFFVVSTHRDNETCPVYVSPDWPSAEAFANQLIERAKAGVSPNHG